MGTFHPFLDDPGVEMYGVEAGGGGVETGRHAASLCAGVEGVFHGMKTYVLQDEYGQIENTHSVAAGLDYSGAGPELSFLKSIERAEYGTVTDDEAVDAFLQLSRYEGIIPALESSHALAHALKLAITMDGDDLIVVTLSGRGDKDVGVIADHLEVEI
jgi:tryptophan synthase beta chain